MKRDAPSPARAQAATLGLRTVVGTALLGLRHRWLLTTASILLILMAEAAAVLSPLYAAESVDSYLVAKLRATTPYLTGVTLNYRPAAAAHTRQAVQNALAPFARVDSSRFAPPRTSLWAENVPVRTWSHGLQAIGSLAAEPGLCRRLVLVAGRCPRRPDETVVFLDDARRQGVAPGTELELRSAVLTVVGTYRLREDGRGAYDPSRMVSLPPHKTSIGLVYNPAPFVVLPSTLDWSNQPWIVRTDYALSVPASTTSGNLRDARRQARQLVATAHGHHGPGSYDVAVGSALRAVIGQVEQRRHAAWRTILPAVASLIVISLVLLLRLFAAAFDSRRPELALARLRGLQGGRLWVFAMSEPAIVVAVGVPAGIVAGYVANLAFAQAWFVPGLPTPFAWSSVWSASAVALAGLLLAVACVWGSTRQALHRELSDAPRRAGRGRARRLVGLMLVAVTVAVITVHVFSGGHGLGAADVLLPVMLAALIGGCLTLVTTGAAQWYASARPDARLPLYIATRAIARRREMTAATLPLTACVATAIFAGAVYSSAAVWRASAAATEVGAGLSFTTDLPMAEAVRLTRRIDPDGRWVTAAGTTFVSTSSFTVVDSSRLARVVTWPATWTPGRSAADVARAIGPDKPPLRLTGHSLSMTVTSDLPRRSSPVTIDVQLLGADGTPHHFFLGPVPPGRSLLRDDLDGCGKPCDVTGLTVTGGGSTRPTEQAGSLTLEDVTLDGNPLPRFIDIGWRPAAGHHTAVTACDQPAQPGRDCLRLELRDRQGETDAVVEPTDVAPIVPVLVGHKSGAPTEVPQGGVFTVRSPAGTTTPLRSAGLTESTPFLGPGALLVDYASYGRILPLDSVGDVHVLARADTPARVLRRITATGARDESRLTEARRTLDDDPLALALNLYLIAAALALAMAIAALCAHFGAELHRRRRDSASLRVIGVQHRVLLSAAMLETLWSVGGAVLAGCVAGVVAQAVTARGLTLGYADVLTTPRVTSVVDGTVLLVAGVAVLVALLAVSALMAAVTIRSANAATAREE